MISKKNFFLVTHATEIFGPPHALAEYLKPRVNKFIFIMYPLEKTVKVEPIAYYFKNGKLIRSKKLPFLLKTFPLNYTRDFLATFYFAIFGEKKIRFDYFIGANNLNCLAGIILKPFLNIKKVIFYTIDYSPVRYKNKVLDWLYHLIDKLAIKYSDFVWSNNKKVMTVRKQQGLIDSNNLLVPNGVDLGLIPKVKKGLKKKRWVDFVCQGHLTKAKGISELIKALARIDQNYQNWKLTIIGSGPFEIELRKLVQDSHLGEKVKFLGRLSNKQTLAKMINFDIGIALYDKNDKYTQFCDPLKVKEYIACGLAVLINNVPPISELIEKEKIGLVVKSGSELELEKSLVKLITDERLLKEFKGRTKSLAGKFDWNYIYDKVFREMT